VDLLVTGGDSSKNQELRWKDLETWLEKRSFSTVKESPDDA
jgi:hypothetical protein